MNEHKVLLLAMKSWGEMGNFNSAHKLARLIEQVGWDVDVVAFDELLPEFAHFGIKLGNLRDQDISEREVEKVYADVMDECGVCVRQMLSEPASSLQKLIKLISERNYRFVIGAKGVISRIVSELQGRSLISVTAANYLTNHGLLDIDIHRPVVGMPQICVTVDAVEHLMHLGVAEKDIFNIRYPGGHGDFSINHQAADGSINVVVFDNHGGAVFSRLVRSLLGFDPKIHLHVIALSPEKYSQLLDGKSSTLVGKMSFADYQQFLADRQHERRTVLVTKAGPNTVFEAIRHELPVIVVPSGLPPEKWVARFVVEREIGRVCNSHQQVKSVLDGYLMNTIEFDQVVERMRAMKNVHFSPPTVIENLVDFLAQKEACMYDETSNLCI